MISLDTFLRRALATTYAAGGPKDATRAYRRSDDYFYEEDGYVYHDRYWGGTAFLGSEVVWHNDTPIWGMNYYGGPVNPADHVSAPSGIQTPLITPASPPPIDIHTAYDFLKHALLAGGTDPNTLPARGPARFTMLGHPRFAGLTYINSMTGTLDNFDGTEEITYHGRPICRHVYHGGAIK